jgi:DNA-binding MarR family transcriptional regulator
MKSKKKSQSKVNPIARSRPIVQPKKADPSAELRALAQHAERQLNVIQRSMRQRLQAEFARGNLTGPQRLVMSELVRTQGLSLKQLSHVVSLAHSTVSGIVDRLVKQGLIERKAHPTDRRITLLVASRPVREFLTTRMPELSLNPLLEALQRASPKDRTAITSALDLLARLLTQNPPASSSRLVPKDIETL